MMRIKLEKRESIPGYVRFAGTISAIFVALLAGAILLAAGGMNPIYAYSEMLRTGFLDAYSISDTIVKATPLILVSLGLTIAFRMKLWNIGAEGQLLIGAWAASGVALFLLPPDTPKILMLLGMTAAGFIGGALWGLIPGVLKAKFGVNEIITSLMLTYIAAFLKNYFVYGPWSVGGFPLTAPFPKSAWFPRLSDLAQNYPVFRGMTAHIGILYAIIAAIIIYIVITKSKWGYQLRVIGDNPEAARYAGMNISKTIITAMVISGGLAGLAGMAEVSGVIHRLQEHISPGYGFTAIIVTWLARLNPLAVIIVGYLFGGLLVGGDAVQPAGIPLLIQGFIMFSVISIDLLISYRIVIKQKARGTSEEIEHGV